MSRFELCTWGAVVLGVVIATATGARLVRLSHRRGLLLFSFLGALLGLLYYMLRPSAQSAVEWHISYAERRVAAADGIRQTALARVASGDEPALTHEACPAMPALDAWFDKDRFAKTPTSQEDVELLSKEWERLALFSGQSVLGTWRAGEPLIGPKAYRAETLLHSLRSWDTPTSADRPWMTPDEAKRAADDLGDVGAWDFDATLVLTGAPWPRSLTAPRWDDLSIDGVLWIWSYHERAFVCAAPVRVERSVATHLFNTYNASESERYTLRGALALHAAARAARSLRRVSR